MSNRVSRLTQLCTVERPRYEDDGNELDGRDLVTVDAPCRIYAVTEQPGRVDNTTSFTDAIVDGLLVMRSLGAQVGDIVSSIRRRNGDTLRNEEFEVVSRYDWQAVTELRIRAGV